MFRREMTLQVRLLSKCVSTYLEQNVVQNANIKRASGAGSLVGDLAKLEVHVHRTMRKQRLQMGSRKEILLPNKSRQTIRPWTRSCHVVLLNACILTG